MIVGMKGYPNTSLLEVRIVCDTLGVLLGHVRKAMPQFQRISPRYRLYFGPLRVIYTSDLDLLRNYLDHLETSKYRYLILIQGSESYLKEQGLSFGQEPFTDLDILDAILNIDSCLRFQDALGPRKDLAKEIFDSVNRGSLLSKLQSSIYRVQDKMDRSKAQMFCYAYLSGSVKKVPSTGYTYLDNILKSPLATVFCKATREVKSGSDLDTVAKKYDVDRFEIAYILKRTGYEFD